MLTMSKTWFRDLYNFPKRSIYDSPLPTPILASANEAAPTPPRNKGHEGRKLSPSNDAATSEIPIIGEEINIPFISVVVPTRGNKLTSLQEAVSSALSQFGVVDGKGVPTTAIDLFNISNSELGYMKQKSKSENDLLANIFFKIEVIVCIDGPQQLDGNEFGGLNINHHYNEDPLKDSRVKIVHHLPASEGKPGLVRNTAISFARGDWVCLFFVCLSKKHIAVGGGLTLNIHHKTYIKYHSP